MCGVVVRFWVVLVGSTFVEWLGSSVSGLRLVSLWFTVVSILSVPGFWVISFRVGLVAGWLCFWFMNWIWWFLGLGFGFRISVVFGFEFYFGVVALWIA